MSRHCYELLVLSWLWEGGYCALVVETDSKMRYVCFLTKPCNLQPRRVSVKIEAAMPLNFQFCETPVGDNFRYSPTSSPSIRMHETPAARRKASAFLVPALQHLLRYRLAAHVAALKNRQ